MLFVGMAPFPWHSVHCLAASFTQLCSQKGVYGGHHNPIILCSSTKIELTIPVWKDIQSV